MSDRYHSLTVVLERDTRDDDAKNLMIAIRQLRNVAAVGVQVADPISQMAETRAKLDMRKKILNALED